MINFYTFMTYQMKTREYKQFEQISKISNIEAEIKSLSKNWCTGKIVPNL